MKAAVAPAFREPVIYETGPLAGVHQFIDGSIAGVLRDGISARIVFDKVAGR
jgi:hypothetical protein